MNHKLNSKLYIYLSIIIVILAIVFIFIHMFLMKSIESVQNLGHKLSSNNILNNKQEKNIEKLNEIQKIEKKNQEKMIVKLEEFSVIINSLKHKKDVVETTEALFKNGNKVRSAELNAYSHIQEDKDIVLVEERFDVEPKNSLVIAEKLETEKTQKERLSLETIQESRHIVTNLLFDNEKTNPIEQIKAEKINEVAVLNSITNITETTNIIHNVDTIVDVVSESNRDLRATEVILEPEIFLNQKHDHITEISSLSNLIATETNNFLVEALPSCEKETQQLDIQSQLIAGKIEALEKTLAFDNHLNEKLSKHADLAEVEIISPSSAKKFYAMQAVEKSTHFKKIVATYQRVSDLYK